MLDDTDLVPRIQSGDLAAFETLYHKYKNELYRTALAIARAPQRSFFRIASSEHMITSTASTPALL